MDHTVVAVGAGLSERKFEGTAGGRKVTGVEGCWAGDARDGMSSAVLIRPGNRCTYFDGDDLRTKGKILYGHRGRATTHRRWGSRSSRGGGSGWSRSRRAG